MLLFKLTAAVAVTQSPLLVYFCYLEIIAFYVLSIIIIIIIGIGIGII